MRTMNPVFTAEQFAQAQGLTWKAAESVVASAIDVPVSMLKTLRLAGRGPRYETTVNGEVYYTRFAVLEYIKAHMKGMEQ